MYDAVWRAAERARRGDGPSLIEAHTIRWVGHFEGDPQAYRGKEEVEEGRRRDPIVRLGSWLSGRGVLDTPGIERIRSAVAAEIEDAVAFAEALNLALQEEMRRDPSVYVIGEDIALGLPFGVTRGLLDEFGPERVLNAPISEAAIVGSALGAAMTGLRPVVDMHFADFVTCAMDEVANQIAKSRYMFGGQVDCPLTLRMPYGIGRSAGGHHSNSVEA